MINSSALNFLWDKISRLKYLLFKSSELSTFKTIGNSGQHNLTIVYTPIAHQLKS